jgi:hypothetical protein
MKDFVFPYELKVDRLSFGTVHLEIEGLRDVEATIDAIFEELKKAHRPELLEGLNRPKTNTRVTSRKLAHHTLSVNRSRFPLCSQIAVDGPPADLQGLHNFHHGEATGIEEPGSGRLGFRRPLRPAVIAAFPLGDGNPGRLPFLAIFLLNLG